MSIAFIGGLNFGTFRTNTSAGRIQFLNQGNMGLSNVVTPQYTLPQIAGVQSFEKSIQLQGLRDQSLFQASLLMGDSTRSLIKKNEDLRSRLMQGGAIFA